MVLASALVFSYSSVGALAAGISTTQVEDGRQQNGLETGQIGSVNITDGPYYVGDKVILSATDVVIDGPLETLQWFGLGEFELTTPGPKIFEVSAATYFKNGKYEGTIHSTTQKFIVLINVEEKVQAPVTMASYSYSNASYKVDINPQKKTTGYDFTANVTITLSNGEEFTTNVFVKHALDKYGVSKNKVVEYDITSIDGTELKGELPIPL